ncbi:MAG: hypothetical protein P8179_20030 [Candidatus Thiodiazotropha sp.]
MDYILTPVFYFVAQHNFLDLIFHLACLAVRLSLPLRLISFQKISEAGLLQVNVSKDHIATAEVNLSKYSGK